MSGRLGVLIRNDARMQYRYGIYFAYAFVILFYASVLAYVGPYLPSWFAGVIIFADPSALGFFFLGAIMMLEKSENTRNAIAITPVSAAQYFWAKCITLTTVSLLATAVLVPFLHDGVNWMMLFAIVALTSIQFLALGVPVALFFQTVTSYLIAAAALFTPVILPGFIALMEPMPQWAIIIPTASQLKLMLIATGSGSATPGEITAMFTVAITACAGTYKFGLAYLKRELGNK